MPLPWPATSRAAPKPPSALPHYRASNRSLRCPPLPVERQPAIRQSAVCNLQSAICFCSLLLQSAIDRSLLRLPMRRMFPAEAAELAQLEPLARLLLVLGRAVVAPLALGARQRNDVSHYLDPAGDRRSRPGARKSFLPNAERRTPTSVRYSRISVIVPAPTVRPPSRIANRAPFSSATGVCSSAVIEVLSPGITISTPSGSVSEPVTSVVRM